MVASFDAQTRGEHVSRDLPRRPRLHELALQRRVDGLFRAMASDFLLREQFVTDPAQVTSEYVHGERLRPDAAATINYFVYSCLASDYLISWFREYAIQHGGRRILRQDFVRDFSRAVVDNRGGHVVSALADLAMSDAPRIALHEDWLQVIFGHWRFGEDGTDGTGTDATGTDSTGTDTTGTAVTDTTGTSTGTDITGTSTGTDITGTSTGTDITGTSTDQTGTGVTDLTGTDLTGTGLTTGPVTNQTLTAVTWTALPPPITQKTTESTTPFTHTGITRSPFTTHTTVDQFTSFLGSSYVIVTLEALTQFARQLIRAGALDAGVEAFAGYERR